LRARPREHDRSAFGTSRRFWNVRLKAALLISVAILAATAGLSWRFLDRRSG